jgi:RNA polymerase sigma-70 factor (ECF subfamily)
MESGPASPSRPSAPVSEVAEERALIARAQARDPEAFRVLVERHRDRAYHLALRIVRVPADAEEVAQDAFVRAWHGLDRYRGEARFSTWLHRIVARRALDRAAVLRSRTARETDLESVAPPVASGSERTTPSEAEIQLERALEGLSPVQRAAITLYYYEDRSVEEVARTLGMPENTVKTHLSRARATLRESWREPVDV